MQTINSNILQPLIKVVVIINEDNLLERCFYVDSRQYQEYKHAFKDVDSAGMTPEMIDL